MVTEKPARQRAPRLPKVREWHDMTRAWWKDVWGSPMAEEYLDADIHGLYRLAILVDNYWVEPTEKLAGEIRLQQQAYGLTPVDRRRLQWEVRRVEPQKEQPKQGKLLEEEPRVEREDPRAKILRFPSEASG